MNILALLLSSMPRINFARCLPLIVFITAGLNAFAQRDSISLATIVSKTDKLANEHPFEKVYLHFDKPYYAVGDTIWFKAYLTIGPKHQLSALSHIIYVDVISNKDSVVSSLKLPTINAVGFGDITLSKDLYKQGNYHIRAYTYWMRNFGPDFFFNKTISIGNAIDNPVAAKISVTKNKRNNVEVVNAKVLYKDRDGNAYEGKKVSWVVENDDETISKGRGVTDRSGYLNISFTSRSGNSPETSNLVTTIDLADKRSVVKTFSLKSVFAGTDVQFFPEGGDLVTGVRSKVAFKAIGPDGLGINITGSIVDNTGNEVTSFTSRHAGMGIFALLPENDKTYKASVAFPDGSKKMFDLPRVQRGGITLAINNNDPENLSIKIAANDEYFKAYRNRGFYIVAQKGGVIYYTALAALQSQVYTGVVAKNKFPTGILQVTLFAANGEPLGERLVFINHNDALDLSLSTNLPVYTSRQHVDMKLNAKSNALPAEGTFSVAVIDESKVPYDDNAETTILSSLLLTSDLRGYIEKPNYYFNHPDDNTLANLDILMLTQGYRRFSYTDILRDKYPGVTFLPEKNMEITGTLRTSTGVPVFKGIVNLRIPSRNISVNSPTDANGQFRFSNVAVLDSTKMILSARNNSGRSNVMLTVDAHPYQPVTKNFDDPNQIVDIDSTLSAYLQNSKKQNESSHVLNEVIVRSTKTTTITHENYSELSGLSPMTDQTITTERLKNCSFDLVSCIMSNVFGITHADDNFYIKRAYDAGNKKPVQFFVNGLGVDYPYLSSMRTEDVGLIEVYLTDGVSGINDRYGTNGIISITTKSGSFTPKEKTDDLQPLSTPGNSVTITPKGYYRARFFYSPKYDRPQGTVQRLSDLRSTIYWNPNIITDKNGNAAFDFYNADGKGTYKAIVEGIDYNGNIGRFVLRYTVK